MLRNYKPKHKKAPWVLAGLKTPPKPQKPSRKPPKGSAGPLNKQLSPREQYRRDARAFVRAERRAGKVCPVVAFARKVPYPSKWNMQELTRKNKKGQYIASAKITEVHHMFGRLGALLLWKKGWMGSSKEGHRWIHANPDLAREFRWLAPKGLWNNPRKVMMADAMIDDMVQNQWDKFCRLMGI